MKKAKRDYHHQLPEFVVIGQISRPHGIRGECKVIPLTNDPDRFKLLDEVFLTLDDEPRSVFHINKCRVTPKAVLLGFKEIKNRTEADRWRNAYLEIPREQVIKLPEGSYYNFELIGMQVVDLSGKPVGLVEDVLEYPANNVYVVHRQQKEFLIPAIPDVIKNIDTETGIITIDPIPGLLDE